MKQLLLDNPPGPDGGFNLGDDIQVIAAQRFMPSCVDYISKSDLFKYCGKPAKLILNGWFMHNPEEWPPSNNIIPLITSFHMNPVPAVRMLEKGRLFFERNAPIGCRDYTTLELFNAAQLPAYYSGCLTLTLERERFIPSEAVSREGVYAVDILYKMRSPGGMRNKLRQFISRESSIEAIRYNLVNKILDRLVRRADRHNVTFLEHSRRLPQDSPALRHAVAHEALCRYANAKLVITSRIHCALPCLAFGTPVVFVDGGLDVESERARLHGITNLMPVLPVYQSGEIDFKALELNLSPELTRNRDSALHKARDLLIAQCVNFSTDEVA